MKPSLTPKALLLLVAVPVAFSLLILLFAFTHPLPPHPTPPAPAPTPVPAAMVDDEYYKIPNGVSYSGQQMTNNAGHLSLSTELGQNYYLVNDTANNTGFLYAEVKADNYSAPGKQRLPLNISLVIDRSGSMSGAKLDNVKKAAGFLIDKLNDKDILSIVVYESNVGVLQKSAPVTDKVSLHATINSIETAGGTNLGGGMNEGFNQVKATYKSGYVNRVLLLSDGLANEGVSDPLVLQGIAKKWFNSESISISTFGVGNDYNENLMTTLAENGGGSYYYIKQPEDIAGIFEKEINGLLAVVAQQAKLTFKLPAGISIARVYGGNYEMDKGNMTVNLKDIFANETKAILIKYRIKAGTNIELPFATRLDFEDATANNKLTSVENLNVMKPVTDATVFLKNFSERVMQQCTIFESNDMLEKAMKAVDERDYDKARVIGNRCQLYSAGNTSQFNSSFENIRQDSIITLYNIKLKEVEKVNEYDRKEMQKSTKSSNYIMRTKKIQ